MKQWFTNLSSDSKVYLCSAVWLIIFITSVIIRLQYFTVNDLIGFMPAGFAFLITYTRLNVKYRGNGKLIEEIVIAVLCVLLMGVTVKYLPQFNTTYYSVSAAIATVVSILLPK